MRLALLLLVLAVLLTAPARAQLSQDEFLALAEAYQEGFLRLTGATVFQLYAGTGIVATAFSTGLLDGPAALDALGENRLLHSVCYEGLQKVQQRTPQSDRASHAELERLARLLVLEDELLRALGDVFSNPTESNSARVELARVRVAKALDDYIAEPPEE